MDGIGGYSNAMNLYNLYQASQSFGDFNNVLDGVQTPSERRDGVGGESWWQQASGSIVQFAGAVAAFGRATTSTLAGFGEGAAVQDAAFVGGGASILVSGTAGVVAGFITQGPNAQDAAMDHYANAFKVYNPDVPQR